ASTKLSGGSRCGILRPLLGSIGLVRVFAGARGVLALLLFDLARLVICVLLRSLSTAHSRASGNPVLTQPGSPLSRGRAERIILHRLDEGRVRNGGQEVASILRLRRNENLVGSPPPGESPPPACR